MLKKDLVVLISAEHEYLITHAHAVVNAAKVNYHTAVINLNLALGNVTQKTEPAFPLRILFLEHLVANKNRVHVEQTVAVLQNS